MMVTDTEWDGRVARLWAAMDGLDEQDFLARMKALVDERPADDPVALYEYGGAHDSTGNPEAAVTLYRRALQYGLAAPRRRQAVIQLASSLRNLNQAQESVALLTAELDVGSDELDDAVRAFLALALTSSGREREAVGVALTALAGHMTRYRRSLTHYAQELMNP